MSESVCVCVTEREIDQNKEDTRVCRGDEDGNGSRTDCGGSGTMNLEAEGIRSRAEIEYI